VVAQWHLVDGTDVQGRDNSLFANVAEQGDFLAFGNRNLALTADQQDIRLDADGPQFFDRMLGGLGLQFARGGDIRHQGEVHKDRLAATQLVAKLADGLEKRQAFDVAYGAADLHQDEIVAVRAVENEFFNGVGDVRDDLHGGAEIVAAAFLADHRLVDTPGGDVIGLG